MPSIDPDLFLVLFVGIAGPAVGLAGLLAARGSDQPLWTRRSFRGLLVVFAGLTLAAWLGGYPGQVWLPPLFLAVACGTFALLRSPIMDRFLTQTITWVRRPRIQWAGLLVACPLTATWWGFHLFLPEPLPDNDVMTVRLDSPQFASASPAMTDGGRSIQLYQWADRKPADANLGRKESALLQTMMLTNHVIRISPPSPACNCHGWVFADGNYWVDGSDVETILLDNQYRAVKEPKLGDLVVYRNRWGRVVHTALIRFVGEEGMILVESKWGRLGQYLHPFDVYLVADCQCTFYRSPRQGHRLHGLTETGSSLVCS